MLQALLKDRFKLEAHFEDQPVNAYTLVAARPKLKKADPASRTGCKAENTASLATIGVLRVPGRVVTCRNITMAEFADQLQKIDRSGESFRPTHTFAGSRGHLTLRKGRKQ
jgi:uncharacterized protein (TIGR03435 family)